MVEDLISYPPIGIAGAARSGKDTLCKGMIRYLSTLNIKAKRMSIAGDTVKNDVHQLLMDKFGIDSHTENHEDKEFIRPLLVEYGKMQRVKTKGRYFINKFKFVPESVNIIPDIRYIEYPNDEVNWLKDEVKGILIFIKRKDVHDANDTEKVNNRIIKHHADYRLEWDTVKNDQEVDEHAKYIIDNFYLPLINRTL